jgi:hypothetical protein
MALIGLAAPGRPIRSLVAEDRSAGGRPRPDRTETPESAPTLLTGPCDTGRNSAGQLPVRERRRPRRPSREACTEPDERLGTALPRLITHGDGVEPLLSARSVRRVKVSEHRPPSPAPGLLGSARRSARSAWRRSERLVRWSVSRWARSARRMIAHDRVVGRRAWLSLYSSTTTLAPRVAYCSSRRTHACSSAGDRSRAGRAPGLRVTNTGSRAGWPAARCAGGRRQSRAGARPGGWGPASPARGG